MNTQRKLRMGMVGGGKNAFIGAVHRMAANLDGQIELVAGCFSTRDAVNRATGQNLYLDSQRVYADYATMAREEAALPAHQRIDFVTIVTPNLHHLPAAKAFLEAGIHVVCEKPMTLDLAEALQLRKQVLEQKLIFALVHNYSGYPMVKEARSLVRSGALGKILKVVAEYPQDWLLTAIEKEGQKQAAWRTDPKQAGASGCIADVGTHAEHLVRYISGLHIEELCADFTSFVPGRTLEDDANILVRYKGGARGIIYASQISAGEENGPHIRIYGERASLEWHQPQPNKLLVKYPDRPAQIYRPGHAWLSPHSQAFTRLPAGHPEGFLEALANLYREIGRAVLDRESGKTESCYDFPDIDDGVYGMAFIETAVRSARSRSWTQFPDLDTMESAST